MFNGKKSVNQGLNIIIVGCGKVGITLIEQLSMEGHDITIIDKNANRVQEMTNLYDIMGLVGNGASYSVQMEAGIEDADLLIAVTDSDELNLLCCIIAKQVGDCGTIARVRTPDYLKESTYLKEKLGLTMIINPEFETSKETARILYLPSALDVSTFAHGQAEIIRFKIPDNNILDGMTPATLGKTITNEILICAVERQGDIYIPDGDFEMQAGDIISIVASHVFIRSFLKNIGFKTRQVKNAMIVGGGNASYYLAKQLMTMGIDIKIIEQDKDRCEELSILLPEAVIINGDGTDQELLHEAGLEYTEAFIPLTGIDEENIMLTLHARQMSDAKTITKIDRSNFKDVINSLDLGSVIYPRYITSEAIIAYVRAKKNATSDNIETLYHMFDSRAEAIEFKVEEESAITGVPLKDLTLKKDLLVASIYRNGKVSIPDGNNSIEVGDSVMVVTTHMGLDNIRDILK